MSKAMSQSMNQSMKPRALMSCLAVLAAFSGTCNTHAEARELVRVAQAASAQATTQATPASADPVAQVQSGLAGLTQAMSAGAQVVVFPYRANKIYQVNIKPGMFTTFTLPRDEHIKQFAVSNPEAAEIVVNQDTSAAMLRLTGGITLSATIVTDKRAYFLTVSPSRESWHQGVSWSYDEDTAAASFGYRAPAGSQSAASPSGADAGLPLAEDSLAGHPNFNYHAEGDASILPVAVWDNGRFTWIQFPDSVQSLPAVFYLGPDGPEVVNYVVQPGGKQVKVNRLMDKIMLRLGSQKAVVSAK